VETPQQRLERESREVEQALRGLFALPLDDGQLRQGMEELGKRWAFPRLLALWGPGLYFRNRVVFRPFILAHFPVFTTDVSGRASSPFEGPSADLFKQWLEEVERREDVEFFRRLYSLQHQGLSWEARSVRWREDLRARYATARTRVERQAVLNRFDLPLMLDEATSLALYAADPDAARPFLLAHLPGYWRFAFMGSSYWEKLVAQARERGDEALALELYRLQVSDKVWHRDALALCDSIPEPGALVEALERHHPSHWLNEAGGTYLELARRRGQDVLPYLLRHLRDVRQGLWGRLGNRDLFQLVDLARERGWWGLWAGLMRTSATPDTYDAEVLRLLKDSRLPEAEVRRRLLLLAGVGQELNFLGFGLVQVQPLTDDTAVRLYERFPDLVRGPFQAHVSPGWVGAYPKLMVRAIEREDESLVDFLASRVVMVPISPEPSSWHPVVERLSSHYTALLERSPEAFASRAGNVLGKVPAFAIRNYAELVRRNRLARLFFERAHASYVVDARAVRDMLESPQSHVQALAFRVLAWDDDRARVLAARNVDLLQAALLRPLHRKTRVMALGALRNAARDESAARQLVGRIRDAMDLPDKRYPKEALLGVLAELLHRWPALRGPTERPVVYGEAP
jgi:hypothetical protein